MTKEMNALAPIVQGSIDGYLQAVNSHPMLSAEEEHSLASVSITMVIWRRQSR